MVGSMTGNNSSIIASSSSTQVRTTNTARKPTTISNGLAWMPAVQAATSVGGTCGTVFSLGVGLGPFVETVPISGEAGKAVRILGNNLTDATHVSFNRTEAEFRVVSASEIITTVPDGATTGFVTVTRHGPRLRSNVQFEVRY